MPVIQPTIANAGTDVRANVGTSTATTTMPSIRITLSDLSLYFSGTHTGRGPYVSSTGVHNSGVANKIVIANDEGSDLTLGIVNEDGYLPFAYNYRLTYTSNDTGERAYMNSTEYNIATIVNATVEALNADQTVVSQIPQETAEFLNSLFPDGNVSLFGTVRLFSVTPPYISSKRATYIFNMAYVRCDANLDLVNLRLNDCVWTTAAVSSTNTTVIEVWSTTTTGYRTCSAEVDISLGLLAASTLT